MVFGILFPEWPSQKQWDKLPGNSKLQWVLLGCLQCVGIGTAGALALFT